MQRSTGLSTESVGKFRRLKAERMSIGGARMNLSEALLHALKAHGAAKSSVFPAIRPAVFQGHRRIADSAAVHALARTRRLASPPMLPRRARGGLSVAAVTYGAGALNMVNPVATAHAEKSPVVVVSGGPGRGRRCRPALHHQARRWIRSSRIFQEVTCAETNLNDAARRPGRDRPRPPRLPHFSQPVYIELPRDMVTPPLRPSRSSRGTRV